MKLSSDSPGGFLNTRDDRKRIGRAFHRQADEYDRHTVVQKRVVASLDRLVATHCGVSPSRILDIGCGTGAVLSALHNRYPAAQLCGLDLAYNMALKSAGRLDPEALLVNGDAESMPFQDGIFDLVVSASTFQWIEQLDNCFRECLRVLAPGGMMCAAFFGGKTLWELQESYRQALADNCRDAECRSGRLQRFKGRGEVQQVLAALGFDPVMVATETEVEFHADVRDLLRSIKGIGAATTARNDAVGGLGWRGILNDMAGIYRSRFQRDGRIPATYEVIYIVARRKTAD
jgi:malonyl-CoA O-methyltransferase